MYGLVTLLPLCATSLRNQGFQISESRLLTLFMLCITIGLLAGSRLMARPNPLFPKLSWGISVLIAGSLYYALSIANFVLFSIATGLLGFGLGIIMATVLINSQNAVGSEDRTVLSGLVQLGRYLGASIGVTVLTGMLPEVSQITDRVVIINRGRVMAVDSAANLSQRLRGRERGLRLGGVGGDGIGGTHGLSAPNVRAPVYWFDYWPSRSVASIISLAVFITSTLFWYERDAEIMSTISSTVLTLGE